MKTTIEALKLDSTCGINMQTIWLIETESGESIGRTDKKHYATLFCAAPELLEALQRIRRTSVKETFYGDIDRFQEWLDGFTAEAISKAEGQS